MRRARCLIWLRSQDMSPLTGVLAMLAVAWKIEMDKYNTRDTCYVTPLCYALLQGELGKTVGKGKALTSSVGNVVNNKSVYLPSS